VALRVPGLVNRDERIAVANVAVDLQAGGFQQSFVSASQCWDATFQTVYETSAPAQLRLVPGEVREMQPAAAREETPWTSDPRSEP
jgi:hypothetical protein